MEYIEKAAKIKEEKERAWNDPDNYPAELWEVWYDEPPLAEFSMVLPREFYDYIEQAPPVRPARPGIRPIRETATYNMWRKDAKIRVFVRQEIFGMTITLLHPIRTSCRCSQSKTKLHRLLPCTSRNQFAIRIFETSPWTPEPAARLVMDFDYAYLHRERADMFEGDVRKSPKRELECEAYANIWEDRGQDREENYCKGAH